MKLRRAGSFSRLMSHDSRRDQSVRVWSLPEGKPVRTLNNHTKAIHDLALRPQSSGLPMIATGKQRSDGAALADNHRPHGAIRALAGRRRRARSIAKSEDSAAR